MRVSNEMAIRNTEASLRMEGMQPSTALTRLRKTVIQTQLVRHAGYSLNFADIDLDELMIATTQSTQGVEDGLERVFSKWLEMERGLR